MKRDIKNSFTSFTEKFTEKRLWVNFKEFSKLAFKLFMKVVTLENRVKKMIFLNIFFIV